ncbi:DUF488 domain-containing protein [Lederbergia galactosidilytica]|uniref:DUF488 domain-containing protein n=1 Tax=Lederbergia galactosidilytica TaxID=217031 RepID=A0A0Q9Y7V2_9BACI|nr:DUF488 domain-containing protein [Lederbergia galactosidilytica]KRG11800.1 hypothetical protein ACA29_14725 [Lederbergia galactosidilytica]KRG12719.1 hypothetical protein ACA30_18270 [Virgibacillus soli]MBP1916520.1 uncharacterized protein YeaO (DUF488 family) [Lederbergia galactosidilytica]OAK71945.1 hypothetical protein ABB05_09900 [Lederbergia galactosidilytica]
MPKIKVKRIYDSFAQSDGLRILVDRIWPRGIKKEEAKLDKWLKEVAPSSELRKWFGHDPNRFEEFKEKYLEELQKDQEKKTAFTELCELAKGNDLTLLYAAKDEKHNQAIILKKEIIKK